MVDTLPTVEPRATPSLPPATVSASTPAWAKASCAANREKTDMADMERLILRGTTLASTSRISPATLGPRP